MKFCIDVAFLEGKGPQRGVEHKEIAGALLSSLATAQIHPDRINFVISDEGSTVVAAAKHVLQHVWRNARWFLCWSHKLAGIGDILRKHDVFSMINLLYRSSSLVKVPMHSARRRRWRERSGLQTVPPNIGDTRWTSWRDGADWYCENWEAWKDFVVLDAGKTKRNEENLSLMHEIHDCITMLNALKNRFEKEAEQLEFFQQLRVLNPRNLSDMDTNLSSYKSLKLDEVPGVQEEWNLYRRTEFRNINNGDELLAWWESRPDSLFKEAVLFLITIPTSSGAVERFFSQAGNVSKKQNKLLNQMRRLAFMARFNLDVETAKHIDTPGSPDWAPCGLGKASDSRQRICTGG